MTAPEDDEAFHLFTEQEGRNLTQSKQTGNGEAEGILREIEELWEDLKKKHQESETKLRETEKVLELLDNLREMERWLEQQEGLLPDPASLKNLEAIKKALKETSILTTEVSSRMSKLRSVGGEMEKLLTLRQFLVEKFRRKMEDVEEKCSSVTDRLESRMSDLKDSLILSEFLQNVQAEEKQVKRRLSQPLKSEVGFHGSLLMSLTEAGQQLIDTGRFDSDKVADPLEELREAVQMLNDAVKEREKVVTAAKDAETLIQLAAEKIKETLCKVDALSVELEETEKDFAVVKCETDLQELQHLTREQERLEIASESITLEVEEVKKQATHLEGLCPDRMQDMGREIQETVQACEKLREKVTENKARLLQATQLQEFFRNYLAMISWTEDTRTCIFSESSGAAGADRKPPSTQRQELDEKIEGKFQEFEELKARGQRLLDEEHHLSETIKERIEELQSMLGWVLVRWRAQKHQRHHGNRKEKRQIQELPGDASIISPLGFQQERAIKTSQPEEKALPTSKISGSSQVQLASTEAEVPKSQPPATLPAWDLHPSESNLQASLARTRGTKGGLPAEELELGSADELAAQEPAQTPLVVMQQPGVMPLGGMVNLILSFGKKGENKLQVQRANSGMEIESEETLHRITSPSF
ncbi:spectrin beta chain-like [Latimeria chalumnae]|uniref:spectrin beta chain-like n=1 Tax=Latimeria chalumnae TaxID=7897 RepID=UPI00313C7959